LQLLQEPKKVRANQHPNLESHWDSWRPGLILAPMGTSGIMPMMAGSGHMMKVMFAVADANGDGALSFEEVTVIHKRIFDRVDANKDGKVTLEELQSFMRE
jgi:EF hand